MTAQLIDAGIARKAVELLRAQSRPLDLVLARAGLGNDTLEQKWARIPFAAHVALLEHAAEAARDPCFGLHLGASLSPRDLGIVGYLGSNAATLGSVLAVARNYMRLLSEGTQIEAQPAGEQVRIVQHLLDPAAAGSQQIAGLGASTFVRLARLLTGTMLAPAWVELPFPECDQTEYRRVLGAPVHLGQPHMAVVLAKEQLLLPAIRADPDLFDLLEQVCREKVQSWVSPEDVGARAEAVLLELLPYGTPSLDRVARRLGTSARSLSRRLAEEGTNFKEIVDRLRLELARHYLERGAHRPKAIAAMLGYKDVSTFHHAFRRWTGTTPAQFRETSMRS